jgi:hypothetical protein
MNLFCHHINFLIDDVIYHFNASLNLDTIYYNNVLLLKKFFYHHLVYQGDIKLLIP